MKSILTLLILLTSVSSFANICTIDDINDQVEVDLKYIKIYDNSITKPGNSFCDNDAPYGNSCVKNSSDSDAVAYFARGFYMAQVTMVIMVSIEDCIVISDTITTVN